jgi:hypothetical protein
MSETELVERLERLERAHRRLKGLALAALVLATALATIYAAQPVPSVITAHEFDVVDNSGKVRAKLSMMSGGSGVMSGGPGMMFYDTEGKTRVELGMMFSESGKVLGGPNPGISFSDARGSALLGMGIHSAGSSWVVLGDEQGYRMNLGSTQTLNAATGETQQTSAASIVMFGNDKERRVIWKAP